jgi:hypothetical protein
MMTKRGRLVVCAVVLALQAASLSAAPVALCRGALSLDLDECCTKLAPGQICPMHHKTHRAPADRSAAWTCICSPSDAVLASIVGVAGPMPVQETAAPVPLPAAIRFAVRQSTLDRREPPTSPPPRA